MIESIEIKNIEKEIISIISEISEVDEGKITPDSSLVSDLDIDSIKTIEVVVAIEEIYKISIGKEDIRQITTVKQVVDKTRELISKKLGISE